MKKNLNPDVPPGKAVELAQESAQALPQTQAMTVVEEAVVVFLYNRALKRIYGSSLGFLEPQKP